MSSSPDAVVHDRTSCFSEKPRASRAKNVLKEAGCPNRDISSASTLS